MRQQKKQDFLLLFEELLRNDMGVYNALEVIRDESFLATKIISYMKEGLSFTKALKNAQCDLFSPYEYVILFASEKAGNLQSGIAYLCSIEKENNQIKEELKNTMIYPLFSIVFAFLGTFMLFYYRDFFPRAISDSVFIKGILKAFFVLLLGSFLFFLYVKTSMKTTKDGSLFSSLSFLCSAGFSPVLALETLCKDDCITRCISALSVQTCLSKGMSLEESFEKSGCKNKRILLRLKISQAHGNSSEAFSFASSFYKRRDSQKRKNCIRFCEPLALLISGVYILVLLTETILPFMFSFGGFV